MFLVSEFDSPPHSSYVLYSILKKTTDSVCSGFWVPLLWYMKHENVSEVEVVSSVLRASRILYLNLEEDLYSVQHKFKTHSYIINPMIVSSSAAIDFQELLFQ